LNRLSTRSGFATSEGQSPAAEQFASTSVQAEQPPRIADLKVESRQTLEPRQSTIETPRSLSERGTTDRRSLLGRLGERRGSTAGDVRTSTGKSTPAPSRQVVAPKTETQQTASPQTTRPTEQAGTDRRSLLSRMQERRTNQQTEMSQVGGSISPRIQTSTRSATQALPNVQSRSTLQSRIDSHRTEVINQMGGRMRTALDLQGQQAAATLRRQQLGSQLNDRFVARRGLDTNLAERTLQTTSFGTGYRRPYLHASYYDRPDLITYHYHHLYSYYDLYHRLHHRVIWPSFYFTIGYGFGPYFSYSYVYPYYHRKYVFLSLGGYWPYDYTYLRYYWYGYHPYLWYGYYPIATETNNYYTYNYYNDDGSVTSYQTANNVPPPAKAQPEPAPQTLADTRFEEGVKSFEAGDYSTAAQRFANAMALSPEDVVLPFAYAQALFANKQYYQAADVLREALAKLPPDKEGVFYPRGLYANDDVLFKQIEELMNKQDDSGDNADLQLLLGYHLLGIGETGYAREPLERAGLDPKNAKAVAVLLKLQEKLEKEAGPRDKAGAEPLAVPDAKTQGSAPTQPAPATAAPSSAVPQASSLESTPSTQNVPDAGTKDLLDASRRNSATPLAAGTTQATEPAPANKEDSNEP
jgi:hypothetical protein